MVLSLSLLSKTFAEDLKPSRKRKMQFRQDQFEFVMVKSGQRLIVLWPQVLQLCFPGTPKARVDFDVIMPILILKYYVV